MNVEIFTNRFGVEVINLKSSLVRLLCTQVRSCTRS